MSSIAEKRQDLNACNHAAKADLILKPRELQRRLEGSERTRREAYWLLGRYAFDVFEKQHKSILPDRTKPSRLAGFDVIARFLSFVPDTYSDYYQEHHVPPSLDQIRGSLKQSRETPKRFQAIPDPAQSVEQAFGLLDYESGFRSPYFRFEETAQGLLFVADDEHFSAHAQRLEYSSDLPEQWQKCPGIRLVEEKGWPAMVDLAVDTPEVFAHDLGIVNADLRNPPTQAGVRSAFLCAE